MINGLTITIKKLARNGKFSVELDARRFERLAALLGLFSSEFLHSLDRAEREVSQGETRRLRGLKDLRQK